MTAPWLNLLAPFFYAATAILFWTGCWVLVPGLVTVTALCSLLLLGQNAMPEVPVQRLLRSLGQMVLVVRDKTLIVLMAWLVAVNLVFIFPFSMILLFIVVPVYRLLLLPAVNLTVLCARGVRWLIGVPGSLLALVVSVPSMRALRYVLLYRIRRPITYKTSALLWRVVNSLAMDNLVLHLQRLRKRAKHWMEWPVAILSLLLRVPFYGFGRVEILFPAAGHLLVVLAPLLLFLIPFVDVEETSSKRTAARMLQRRQSDAAVYQRLSCSPLSCPVPGRNQQTARFRLLTLAPGGELDLLHSTLEVADLSTKTTNYEALSYVWGPPDLCQSIKINGKTFAVSKTLKDALIRLRLKVKPRTIWVDAICINQTDNNERKEQVQLMDRIYLQAERVLVWLGDNTPWGLREALQDTKEEVHYGAVRAVSDLLRRPWWTRVWIVQEAVLAKDIELHCGSEAVDWERFCALVTACLAQPYANISGLYCDELRTVMESRALRHEDHRKQHARTDLAALIYNFRGRQATEPRDRVFAFQGLVEDNASRLIVPDYDRPASLLSIDLARAHIRSSRSLCMVALAESTRQTHSFKPPSNGSQRTYLPSWCPAFMDSTAVRAGMRWRPLWTGLPEESGDASPLAAAAGKMAIPLDKLEALQDCSAPDENDYVSVSASYRLKVSSVRNLQSVITHVGPVAESTLGDLAASVHSKAGSSAFYDLLHRHLSWETVLPSWRAMQQEDRVGLDLTLDHSWWHQTLTAGRFSSSPPSEEQELEQEYLTLRTAVCAGRCGFRTATGAFGLGPAGLKVGDEVHVLLGSQVPMVLRRASVEWGEESQDSVVVSGHDGRLFIGQAYVHSLMAYEGNLAADIDNGVVTLEEKVLV